jgi:hypothetical protein
VNVQLQPPVADTVRLPVQLMAGVPDQVTVTVAAVV